MTKPKIGRPSGTKENKEGLRSFKLLSRDALSDLYASGKTTREIGATYGISRTAVDNQFIRMGIARRWHDATGEWKNAKMSIGLLPAQKQLLLGSLLGDACLHHQRYTRRNGDLKLYEKVTFAHGLDQRSYLEHKRLVMLEGREALPKTCVSRIGPRPEGSNIGKQMFQFSFSHDPTLREFVRSFDIRDATGKIMVSQTWAEALEPSGFAYWFLDDGHIRTKVTNGHSRFQISTNAYDADELELLLSVVRGFGGTSAKLSKAREGQYVIVVSPRHEVEILGRLIAAHSPECMKHKLKDLQ